LKSILLKVGLLTTLSVGLVAGKASAEEMDWATKCLPMGEIKPNLNPNFQQINCLLTNAALSKNIPPEVVKAVAETESSGWKQFDENGQVVSDSKGGYGIMQVTDTVQDPERVKSDIIYNIEQGVNILNSKYELQNSSSIPRIKDAGREIIENWYFPVMAYNGLKPVNSPIFRSDGKRNWTTYQDKVFNKLELQSLLGEDQKHNILANYPFEYDDFIYDSSSSENLKFKTPMPEYIMSDGLHESVYMLEKGSFVKVTKEGAQLRTEPTTSSTGFAQPLNKTFKLDGEFKYTKELSSKNVFVWFHVTSPDGKTSGYISSANLAKKKDFVPPIVTGVKNNAYYNKDVKITYDEGTSLLNGAPFKNGTTVTKEGKYTLVVKDEESNTTTITFIIDKTRPITPSMKSVSDLSTSITGKAEAGSTVKLSISGKYQKSTTAASDGSYKFTILKQKSGTNISVTATDKAGNVSPVKTTTIPKITTINKVTTKSKSVTGSAEKYATVRIYRGSTLLKQGSVNSIGKFSVAIPAQKVNTNLKVTVTDKAGNVNGSTIKVVK